MHFFRALSVTLLLVSATSFADDKKPAPPPAADTSAGDIQKFREFWDKLVDIAVATQDNCDKMGTDLTAHLDANKDILDKARAAAQSGKPMPKDLQDHMQETRKKVMPAFQKCGKNDKVQAVLKRLDLRH
jgi:hypothetical protein